MISPNPILSVVRKTTRRLISTMCTQPAWYYVKCHCYRCKKYVSCEDTAHCRARLRLYAPQMPLLTVSKLVDWKHSKPPNEVCRKLFQAPEKQRYLQSVSVTSAETFPNEFQPGAVSKTCKSGWLVRKQGVQRLRQQEGKDRKSIGLHGPSAQHGSIHLDTSGYSLTD